MAGKLIISKQLEKAVGVDYLPITDATGCQQYDTITNIQDANPVVFTARGQDGSGGFTSTLVSSTSTPPGDTLTFILGPATTGAGNIGFFAGGGGAFDTMTYVPQLTSLTFASPNLQYTDENGAVNNIDISGIRMSFTVDGAEGGGAGVAVNNGDTLTFDRLAASASPGFKDAAGPTITYEEFLTSVSYVPATNILTYTDENAVANDIDLSDLQNITGQIEVADSSCIDFTLTGTGTVVDPYNITASPILSLDAGNIIECRGSGLFAAAGAVPNLDISGDVGTAAVIIGTDTINFTLAQVAAGTGNVVVAAGSPIDTVTINENLTSYTQGVFLGGLTGRTIGNYQPETGAVDPIQESVTTLVDNADGTFTYISEGGVSTTFDADVWSWNLLGEATGPFTVDSTAPNVTITSTEATLLTTATAGQIDITYTGGANGEVLTWTAGGVAWTSPADLNSISVISDVLTAGVVTTNDTLDRNRILTHSDGAAAPTITTIYESVTEYADGVQAGGLAERLIGTFTHEDGGTSAINESVTTVTEAPAGTFTYVSEDGTSTAWVIPTVPTGFQWTIASPIGGSEVINTSAAGGDTVNFTASGDLAVSYAPGTNTINYDFTESFTGFLHDSDGSPGALAVASGSTITFSGGPNTVLVATHTANSVDYDMVPGADGQILTTVGGAVVWAAAPSAETSTLTNILAAGVVSTNDTLDRNRIFSHSPDGIVAPTPVYESVTEYADAAQAGILAERLIGTFTHEDGGTSAINESVTTLVQAPAGTFTYTSEDGTLTAWTIPPADPFVCSDLNTCTVNDLDNSGFADGSMWYVTGGVVTAVPIGVAGQVLTVVGGIPVWQPAAGYTWNIAGDVGGSAAVASGATVAVTTTVVAPGAANANDFVLTGDDLDLQLVNATFAQNDLTGVITYTDITNTAFTAEVRSTDVGNLITVGSDGGSYLNCAAVLACGVGDLTHTTEANPTVSHTASDGTVHSIQFTGQAGFVNVLGVLGPNGQINVNLANTGWDITDGTTTETVNLGETLTVQSPNGTVDVEVAAVDTLNLEVRCHYLPICHTGFGTVILDGDTRACLAIHADWAGYQIESVTYSSTGGTGTTTAQLLNNGAAIGAGVVVPAGGTATEAGINQVVAAGDFLQIQTSATTLLPEGLTATVKICKVP